MDLIGWLGTHYQLLWYIGRVFLPGRRQLCRLSALIQPSQYADILTQKEIRMYALKLLSGKDDWSKWDVQLDC